jgi:hypothetical protein
MATPARMASPTANGCLRCPPGIRGHAPNAPLFMHLICRYDIDPPDVSDWISDLASTLGTVPPMDTLTAPFTFGPFPRAHLEKLLDSMLAPDGGPGIRVDLQTQDYANTSKWLLALDGAVVRSTDPLISKLMHVEGLQLL